MSDKPLFPYPRVGVALWVVTDSGSILLKENETHQFDLPFEAVRGGEDWLTSVERIQNQFFGRSFSAGLAGLSHWTCEQTKETWAFVIFKVKLSEAVPLVKGVWKTSLKGLKLASMFSQVRETIDTPDSSN